MFHKTRELPSKQEKEETPRHQLIKRQGIISRLWGSTLLNPCVPRHNLAYLRSRGCVQGDGNMWRILLIEIFARLFHPHPGYAAPGRMGGGIVFGRQVGPLKAHWSSNLPCYGTRDIVMKITEEGKTGVGITAVLRTRHNAGCVHVFVTRITRTTAASLIRSEIGMQ